MNSKLDISQLYQLAYLTGESPVVEGGRTHHVASLKVVQLTFDINNFRADYLFKFNASEVIVLFLTKSCFIANKYHLLMISLILETLIVGREGCNE